MNSIYAAVTGILLTMLAGAQAPRPDAIMTPALERMAAATKLVEANPERFQNYNQLALALTRRARETGDASFLERAQDVLEKSFSLSPDNLEGLKIRSLILLGQHEYDQALAQATVVNKRWPDDVIVYGYIADAQMGLGHYQAAEDAVQWMLDFQPRNVPGLERAATLRELYGDFDGAAEFFALTLKETPPNDVEDQAWILTRLGRLQLQTGHLAEAESYLTRAQAAFPDYHDTLEALAELRRAQGKQADAAALLQTSYRLMPRARNAYLLAVALDRAGEHQSAATMFAEFERKALLETTRADNANRELVWYDLDQAHRPADALRIARLEASTRGDLEAQHAYACALAANGQFGEAHKAIDAVLAIGVRDAVILYHAGAIAEQGGDVKAAVSYFKQSVELNAVSAVATDARQALSRLDRASSSSSSARQ